MVLNGSQWNQEHHRNGSVLYSGTLPWFCLIPVFLFCIAAWVFPYESQTEECGVCIDRGTPEEPVNPLLANRCWESESVQEDRLQKREGSGKDTSGHELILLPMERTLLLRCSVSMLENMSERGRRRTGAGGWTDPSSRPDGRLGQDEHDSAALNVTPPTTSASVCVRGTRLLPACSHKTHEESVRRPSWEPGAVAFHRRRR